MTTATTPPTEQAAGRVRLNRTLPDTPPAPPVRIVHLGGHVTYLDQPVRRVLSIMPTKYEDIWTAAKGSYRLEPIVADGGEVIIYAPHITEVSVMHPHITEIGYHNRDYFLGQWDRFRDQPWGDLAHSTHLRGQGTWTPEDGERNRVTVTLAAGIPEDVVRSVNLNYLDPAQVDVPAYEADPDTFVEPHAGEAFYRLRATSTDIGTGEPGGRGPDPVGLALMSAEKTVVVVMGVAGSGKSTIAELIAQELGWTITDADDLHSPENVAKMAVGIPLTDDDREPWLRLICRRIDQTDGDQVVACSALRRRYRDILRTTDARVRFLYLEGSRHLISSRLDARTGHFMPSAMLQSQLATLEPLEDDEDGASITIDGTPHDILHRALTALSLCTEAVGRRPTSTVPEGGADPANTDHHSSPGRPQKGA